jgi:phospholipid/cholesterol/gamma-HCH transport system substrate-binding protein
METRSNQILVGSIVLGMLVALVVFIIWLSQFGEGGEKTYDIFFQQSIEGLEKGSGVTFRGVPVGQIKAIHLEPRSPQFIRVRISVSDTTPVLEGTTATIRTVGFTGPTQIQLDPPPPPPPGSATPARAEIVCPRSDPESECPYGYPVIPTRPGALASHLNSAPELLERVTTLTERLTELLSDRNQQSIAAILDNVQEISRNLSRNGPEITATINQARTTLQQAGEAAEQIGRLAGTTNNLLDRDGHSLITDLQHAIQSADQSMQTLNAAVADARPGIQTFSGRTLPEVGQLVRDLRATSESLRAISERLDQQGVRGVIGGERLPDYRPGRGAARREER